MRGISDLPPIARHGDKGVVHTRVSGYPKVPLPAPGLVKLGISDAAFHALSAALQGGVEVGVGVALHSPSTTTPSGRVAPLSLIHPHFACGVAGDADLTPIWEEVAHVKGCTEGLSTLNQTLLRGLPACQRIFRGREYFSASLPLLAFVKTVYFMNYSLEPASSGGGVTPWMTCQGMVRELTCRGLDAFILAQHLDGQMTSADPLRTSAQVHLAVVLSANEVIRDLGNFDFVAPYLLSMGGAAHNRSQGAGVSGDGGRNVGRGGGAGQVGAGIRTGGDGDAPRVHVRYEEHMPALYLQYR